MRRIMRQPWLVMTIGNRRGSMNFTALDYESTQKHVINIMSQWSRVGLTIAER